MTALGNPADRPETPKPPNTPERPIRPILFPLPVPLNTNHIPLDHRDLQDPQDGVSLT